MESELQRRKRKELRREEMVDRNPGCVAKYVQTIKALGCEVSEDIDDQHFPSNGEVGELSYTVIPGHLLRQRMLSASDVLGLCQGRSYRLPDAAEALHVFSKLAEYSTGKGQYVAFLRYMLKRIPAVANSVLVLQGKQLNSCGKFRQFEPHLTRVILVRDEE